ncbi:MAG TPA: hypothetical protein VKU41_21530 [Polyangiaceae bacterium]|nr:hypothetical protein [Polyangiaceae bacterium]
MLAARSALVCVLECSVVAALVACGESGASSPRVDSSAGDAPPVGDAVADFASTDAPGSDAPSSAPGTDGSGVDATVPIDGAAGAAASPADGADAAAIETGGPAVDGESDSAFDAASLATWDGSGLVHLSTDEAIDIIVAKDERHLAYSPNRTDYTGAACWGRNGLGDLKVMAIEPTPSSAAVDSLAGFNESSFTDDSRWLVFTKYTAGVNPCSDLVYLSYVPSSPAASTDAGSRVDLDSFAYYYEKITIAGTSVVWRAFGGAANDPGTLYAQKIGGDLADLGSGAGVSSLLAVDPTGAALVYDAPDAGTRLASIDGTTLSVLSGGAFGRPAADVWSPDGRILAYAHVPTSGGPTALTLLNPDGTNPQTLSANCRCSAMTFSQDSSELAYDVPGTGGGLAYVATPTSGGNAATLTGIPSTTSSNLMPALSPDGKWLDVTEDEVTLFTAPTGADGPFIELSSHYQDGTVTTTPAHDYLAFLESAPSAGALVVTTPSGNAIRPAPSGALRIAFEQTRQNAHLAVLASTADGGVSESILPPNSVTPARALPGPAGFQGSLWLGTSFLYAINSRTEQGQTVFDLVVASDDGSHAAVLATSVVVARYLAQAPTRLFFARGSAAGGGIYMFAP